MMAAMRVSGAPMLAILMTLLQFGHCSYLRNYEDISKFYSDNARIQTLYTTMGTTECKYDKVSKTNSREAEFTRYFLTGPSLDLVGKFVNHRHLFQPAELDTMDVQKKKGNDYELRVKKGNDAHGKCYHKFISDTKKAGVFGKIKHCKPKQ
uniref:Lipocalin n=1 Tax=Rhipicephalus appendiculatus TaxID=34631 RepID=A0A131Z5X9_RHIAP